MHSQRASTRIGGRVRRTSISWVLACSLVLQPAFVAADEGRAPGAAEPFSPTPSDLEHLKKRLDHEPRLALAAASPDLRDQRDMATTTGPPLYRLYVRPSSRSRYEQSGGSGQSSDGTGWLALAIVGTVTSLIGVGLGSYGDSDKCHAKNLPYYSDGKLVNVCDNYSQAGLGLAIGGLVVGVVGFIGGIASNAHRNANGNPAGAAPMPSPGMSGPTPTMMPAAAPADHHVDSAISDGVRQAIEDIRAQNPGVIPPAQVAGTNRGGATTLEVQNRTAYTLHLFLNGPQSTALDLPPGQSGALRLMPGQYEMAARVDTFNVRPFYGVQMFQSGTKYGESFYIGTQ
jgi:hypothetical protein